MKVFVVVCALIALVAAEAPFAPYPPSGWKPQGARLELPTEYGPPPTQEEQQQPEHYEVEITKENIEYAGQLGETTTVSNEYLPPTTENVEQDQEDQDPLSVQGLPSQNQGKTFNSPPATQQQRLGQFRRLPAVRQPQNQFQFQQQTAFRPQFGRLEQPAQEYGPPQPAEPENASPEVEDGEGEEEEVEQDNNGNQQPSIAVANAGQYYVLTPENTLQRVRFLTTQTDDDKKSNGFTAQLKYAPVEPIRDPIYAYNDQGQLVRVYNKK